MAEIKDKGMFKFAGSYEVNAATAIDPRVQWDSFEDLIKNGFKKVSIVAASNCNYINGKKRIDVYKNYKWEVIRMKNEEGGKE